MLHNKKKKETPIPAERETKSSLDGWCKWRPRDGSLFLCTAPNMAKEMVRLGDPRCSFGSFCFPFFFLLASIEREQICITGRRDKVKSNLIAQSHHVTIPYTTKPHYLNGNPIRMVDTNSRYKFTFSVAIAIVQKWRQ